MRYIRACWMAVLAGGLSVAAAVQADTPPAPAAAGEAVVDMAPVLVTGAQPGPGLWRVTRGDHVLYILGTQSPLPAGMQWQADEVRQVLAEAGAVLDPPGVSFGADVGFLRGLALAPSALRAMRNPGGGKLQDVLPPELYERWSRLKTRYLGRDRGIEKKRPVIAAFQLYQAALRGHGLRGGLVRPVVAPVLEARGLKPVSTTLELTVDDPRQALAEFRAEPARQEDLDCVARTLDLIEHGLPQVSRRANAWATGDVAALRAMPEAGNQTLACLTAWTGTGTARRRGFTDLDRQVRERWLEAALAALDGHPVSFAMLPIDSLLHDRGGYVSALQARGCQVHAADEEYDGEESLPGPGNTAAAGV